MAQFPEMNPGPVCRLDTGGRIVLANRATRALLGRDVVKGECWLDLCPGVDRVFFDKVLASDSTQAIEARIGDLKTDHLDMFFMHGVKDAANLEPEFIKMGQDMKKRGAGSLMRQMPWHIPSQNN